MRTYLLEKSRVVFQVVRRGRDWDCPHSQPGVLTKSVFIPFARQTTSGITTSSTSCVPAPTCQSSRTWDCVRGIVLLRIILLRLFFCCTRLLNAVGLVVFAVSADKFCYTGLSGDITIEGIDDRKDMEETRQTFSLLGRNRYARNGQSTILGAKCGSLSFLFCPAKPIEIVNTEGQIFCWNVFVYFQFSFLLVLLFHFCFLLQVWRTTSSWLFLKFWLPSCTWAMWKSENPEATSHLLLWGLMGFDVFVVMLKV